MSKLKNRKPKVKFRSYGSGEKLPIVKSDGDFYLADQSYENLGHGDFIGQNTTKLEGPSKRAIRGKGKKSKNVRVYTTKEKDPIFLEDTSSMKRMMTPMKQEDGFDYGDKNRAKTEKDKYGFTKNLKSLNKQAKQDSKEKAKATKKAAKEKAKSSPETIAKKEDRKAKATDIVHSLGRTMEAFGTGKATAAPSKTKTEELAEDREKKTTKPSDNLKIDKSDGLADLGEGTVSIKSNKEKFTFRKGYQGETKSEYEAAYKKAHDEYKSGLQSPATRRDMALMRKAMQKIKKPLSKY